MTQRNSLWSKFKFVWEMAVNVVGVIFCIYVAYRSARVGGPNGRTRGIGYLILGLFLLLAGVIRLVRRKRRNYFEEEMAHRRSLVRDDEFPHLKAKS